MIEKRTFSIRQIIILFFVIGLMTSCSENKKGYDHPTVQQLMSIKNVDFDNVEGVKHFITTDKDKAEEWRSKESKSGCVVYGRFNKKTGEYICKSIPREKVTLPTEEEISNLVDENGEFLLED